MRIDRHPIHTPIGAEGPAGEQSPGAKPGQTAGVQAAGVDAQVGSALEPYIALARGSDEVNAQAVAEAKALLASGELDTPDAARRAAESLLSFGV